MARKTIDKSIQDIEFNFKYNKKQFEALTTHATEVLFGGAKGCGKSYLARQAAVTCAFNIPGLQVYIFRESYSEVKRNYLFGADGFESMLADLESAGLCNINASEPRIHFYNGSDIYLRHMNTPSDVEQIRGNDVHFLIADEAAQWLQKDIYYQLRTCMRCGLAIDYKHLKDIGLSFIKPGFFPRSLLLSNPGGRAHAFIKQEFIDSLEPNVPKQMPEDKGGMLRQFIPAFLEDNKALIDKDPGYRAKLLGSGKHVRAMLEGDWSIPDGAALADEWSPRWNVMKPFDVPPSARVKRCFDWGIAKPFAVTYVWETRNEAIKLNDGSMKTFPAGTMIVIGELYGWSGNADEGCRKTAKVVGEMIKKYEMRQPWASQITQGPSDGSIWNGTGTDKTINDDIVEGFNDLKDKSSTYGQTVRSSLFQAADKSKGSRAKGLALVKSYLYGAHGEEIDSVVYPSEKAGLIFFETCRHCLRTLPVIPFDDKDPDDVDTKSEDHIYDTVRYAVLGRTPHFERLELTGI
jgi:hypothetical protein